MGNDDLLIVWYGKIITFLPGKNILKTNRSVSSKESDRPKNNPIIDFRKGHLKEKVGVN